MANGCYICEKEQNLATLYAVDIVLFCDDTVMLCDVKP